MISSAVARVLLDPPPGHSKIKRVSPNTFFFISETKLCNPNQCVKHPTFISSWTKIVAQDSSQSEIVINHNLNEIPIKVDVQVKQVTGNDTDFIFTGIGSAQRDDDYDSIYGGIVYMYDNNSVILIAPNRNDGSNKGVSIFTGT